MQPARRCLAALRHAVGYGRRRGLDLLFPPECVNCGQELPEVQPPTEAAGNEPGGSALADLPLCEGCQQALLAGAEEPRCPRCGSRQATTAGHPKGQAPCADCGRKAPPYDAVIPLGCYEGELRRAVLRGKKVTQTALTAALVELFWQQRQDQIFAWRPDIVVPIPMHWTRRWSRGVNAPEIFATHLARRLGLPAANRLLRRQRNTRQQGELLPTARARNVRHAFCVRATYVLNSARVLLVDDILTTGATCAEATRMLKHHGASAVAVVVVARADRPH